MPSSVDCGDKLCRMEYLFSQTCILYVDLNEEKTCQYPCTFVNCKSEIHHLVLCPIWSCDSKTTPAPEISTLSPLPPLPTASSCSPTCVTSLVFNGIFSWAGIEPRTSCSRANSAYRLTTTIAKVFLQIISIWNNPTISDLSLLLFMTSSSSKERNIGILCMWVSECKCVCVCVFVFVHVGVFVCGWVCACVSAWVREFAWVCEIR